MEFCNPGSRVGSFPSQTLIIMLLRWPKFHTSRFITTSMNNYPGNHRMLVYKKGFVHQIVSRSFPFNTSLKSHVIITSDPTCVLLHPHIANLAIDNNLFTKILVCLATWYNKPVGAVHRQVSINDMEVWGKVQVVEGDTMIASLLVKSS